MPPKNAIVHIIPILSNLISLSLLFIYHRSELLRGRAIDFICLGKLVDHIAIITLASDLLEKLL